MGDGGKNEWRAGAFKAWLQLPSLEREQVDVAGWIREPFALDFRAFLTSDNDPTWRASGWVITHLPTGYSTFAVHAPLDQAMAVVDRLVALGDWSWTDPSEAAKIRPDARGIKLALGNRASHPGDAIAPWNSFGMKGEPLYADRADALASPLTKDRQS